jgi:hypothetical protein
MSKKKDGPPVFRKDHLNFGSSGLAYHLLKKLVSRPETTNTNSTTTPLHIPFRSMPFLAYIAWKFHIGKFSSLLGLQISLQRA